MKIFSRIKGYLKRLFVEVPSVGIAYPMKENIVASAELLAAEIEKGGFYERCEAVMRAPEIYDAASLRRKTIRIAEEASRIIKERSGEEYVVSFEGGELGGNIMLMFSVKK